MIAFHFAKFQGRCTNILVEKTVHFKTVGAVKMDNLIPLIVIWHVFCACSTFAWVTCLKSYLSSKPLGQQTLLDAINKDFLITCALTGITSNTALIHRAIYGIDHVRA